MGECGRNKLGVLVLGPCVNSLPTPGSMRNRWKPNSSKVLGRSPLTILQDDNSPGTLTLRQVKEEKVKAVIRISSVEGGRPFYPDLPSPEQQPPNSYTAVFRVSGLHP